MDRATEHQHAEAHLGVTLDRVQMRDPFLVAVDDGYVLIGTTDANCWNGPFVGFDCWTSHDLVTWHGPIAAFRPPPGFWADQHFWAPEIHRHRGRWYLFASFKTPGRCRGTQVLVADAPTGPYLPHSDGPVTPADRECLDGTLHIDERGAPWMVFCHEWVQIGDGTMCAVRLADDLRSAIGEPTLLFRASSAPWTRPMASAAGDRAYVTDGPFLHRTAAGTLLMLWSSLGPTGYAMGCARSAGGVLGPWFQRDEPLFADDGGHGMVVRAHDGRLLMVLHQPNQTPHERPRIIAVRETTDGLVREPP